ncbi:lysogeny maintenance protein PflM [Zestomonas carbonaria]|uniref:lysogeny maintenance protein PflM n=1 Tax=Zestomonas carbonaria TaxID=2762745 RepID=UPI0016576538|nr:DUF5447 family protein [Pseudomonas carbonaria]
MSSLNRYLRQPHAENCGCSVCWSRREVAKPAHSQSTPCTQCRPVSVSKVDGRWKVIPASLCDRHQPADRPPKWWFVVYDSGKPTPFVPIREPFED